MTTRLVLLILDVVCGLLVPLYESLYQLRLYKHITRNPNHSQRTKQYNPKMTHWTTYWIFYSVLHLISCKLLYFFPFIYELRVILTLLMAHPKIEAASLLYNFLVTNPLITIRIIDARNKVKDVLEKDVLPKLASFRAL